MPKLKTVYEKEEDIPEGYVDLYVERNGKFELNGIEGVKTQADIDRVTEGLRKEKSDHKETKGKLAKFGDIDPETLPATLAELEEVKTTLDALKKDGKGLDETKVQPMIEAAVKRALGPVEREKISLERSLAEQKKLTEAAQGEVVGLKGQFTQSKIETALRNAAADSKVIATAIDDAVMVGSRVFDIDETTGKITTRDMAGVTAGLDPKAWLKDMQEHRPHWWPASQGGGSQGGRGNTGNNSGNPWSAGAWNITAQGAYIKQHGAEKAAQAAESVGSKVGATKPTVPNKAA